MKTTPLALLLALPCLAAGGAAQTVLTETRTFQAEEFAGLSPNFFDFAVGPISPTRYDHGTPVWIEIDLTVDWDLRWEITNNAGQTEIFEYWTPVDLIAQLGDCTAYANSILQDNSGPIPPGGITVVGSTDTTQYSWSGSTFNIGCFQDWRWPDAYLWTSILDSFNRLSYCGGCQVPADWITVLADSAYVTGHMTVQWMPNELPHTSVCPGNASSPATLTPMAALDNLWLVQDGAPADFNLLVRSPTASTSVPPNGLCVTQGGQWAARIPASLSLGGEPFFFPEEPALAGTTHYFQAWFRNGPAGAEAGECIGVTFP